MEYKRLLGLKTEDYEYEFDRSALQTLRNFTLFESVTNYVLNLTEIRWAVIELCGNRLHCTPDSLPDLYSQIRSVVETLDVEHMPEVYLDWGYFINAYTTGVKENTILCLFSGAVDLLTEEELRFVVGHEVGHQKSKHVLFHVMVSKIAQILTDLGIAKNLALPFTAALYYWYRMSEFTADRAGLLACQDVNVAISALMKMAGLPSSCYKKSNVEGFIKQAREFQNRYSDGIDKFIKSWEILDDSHPWTILRAAELIRWVDSGEYQALLDSIKTKKCSDCNTEVPMNATICPICGSPDFII